MNTRTWNLLLILLSLVALLFFWMPGREALQKGKGERELANQNLQLKQSELEQLEQALEALKTTKGKNTLSAVPQGANQDVLIETLADISEKSGFTLNAMNFTLSENEENQKTMAVAANISGNLANMARFLQSVERAPRYMNIQSLNLQLTSAETVTFNISLLAYYQ